MFRTAILVMAIAALSGCKEKLGEMLSKEIPIKGSPITFTIHAATPSFTRASEAETTLYDTTIDVNISKTVEDAGFSFDHIKNFVLKKGKIKLITGEPFDVAGLQHLKLYFDSTSSNNLVAKADRLSGTEMEFSIVNGELLNKLKNDRLHLILVGTPPTSTVTAQLLLEYAVKVSAIK